MISILDLVVGAMKERILSSLLVAGAILIPSCETNDPRVPFDRGLEMEKLGRYAEAAKAYEQAIQIDPGFAQAYEHLGGVDLEAGEFKAAEQDYRAAAKLRPDDAAVHSDLGQALMVQKKYPEAEEEFRTALRLDPDLLDVHLSLGYALKRTGQVPEAEEEYRAVLARDPQNVWAHYDLATCYVLDGQNEKALVSLQDVVERGFDNWPVLSHDPDLAGLSGDPRYEDLARTIRVRWTDSQGRAEG